MPRDRVLSLENMRALFLKHAEEIIVQKGYQNVTVRAIAEKAGYSAGTLYLCFNNLEDLLMQVEIVLLRRLQNKLQQTLDASDEHVAIENVLTTYIKFAADNAELWNLIHMSGYSDRLELPSEYTELFKSVRDIFYEAKKRQDGAPDKMAAGLIWSATHGIASISTNKKVPILTRSDSLALAKKLAQSLEA